MAPAVAASVSERRKRQDESNAASRGREQAGEIMQLKRVGDGPIMTPRKNIPWEKDAVLNAAAVHHGGKFHLLYRAVAHYPDSPNHSCIGYASSTDGVHFDRLDEPVLRCNERPEESQGVEDPRVVRIGRTFYMCYTAYALKPTQIALATSKDLVHWERQGVIFSDSIMGSNKDASLFPRKFAGRYCLMHRPHPDIFLSFSKDLHNWTDHVRIMKPECDWEVSRIGGGSQPIETDHGWLMVYHGVDSSNCYRLGLVLLDLDDPRKVIKRDPRPCLEPEMEWELKGDVNNVCFTCGAVLLGNELWVYYGSADTVMGLAKGNIGEFLR